MRDVVVPGIVTLHDDAVVIGALLDHHRVVIHHIGTTGLTARLDAGLLLLRLPQRPADLPLLHRLGRSRGRIPLTGLNNRLDGLGLRSPGTAFRHLTLPRARVAGGVDAQSQHRQQQSAGDQREQRAETQDNRQDDDDDRGRRQHARDDGAATRGLAAHTPYLCDMLRRRHGLVRLAWLHDCPFRLRRAHVRELGPAVCVHQMQRRGIPVLAMLHHMFHTVDRPSGQPYGQHEYDDHQHDDGAQRFVTHIP